MTKYALYSQLSIFSHVRLAGTSYVNRFTTKFSLIATRDIVMFNNFLYRDIILNFHYVIRYRIIIALRLKLLNLEE